MTRSASTATAATAALLVLALLSGCGTSSDAGTAPIATTPSNLPAGFSTQTYWDLNPSLQPFFLRGDSLGLVDHWINFGQAEGRPYLLPGTIVGTSSIAAFSAISLSSASALSSPSAPSSASDGCQRTLVSDAYFKFITGDPMIRGWNEGGILQFAIGDRVVPAGTDCALAVTVGPFGSGDLHNMYTQGLLPWMGAGLDSTLIEKVVVTAAGSSAIPWSNPTQLSSTISPTSSIVPSSAWVPSSSATSTACMSWFTEALFNTAFPNRRTPYTYTAFKAAMARVPNFICGTGRGVDDQKRELAAVFAHYQQETAGLVYNEEICGTNGSCWGSYNTDWSNGSYPAQPGKSYHGRGSKQISWPGNYGEASAYLYGDKMVLLRDPDIVKNDGTIAFATGMWFWVARDCVGGFWGTGFGATTNTINGSLECAGNYGSAAQARESYYGRFLGQFGVSDTRSKTAGCRAW